MKEDNRLIVAKKAENLSLKFSVLGLACCLIYTIIFTFIGHYNAATVCLLLSGIMGWAYISNRKGKIDPGRILTILFLNIGVFIVDLMLGRNSGLFLLFIPLMAAAFVLFSIEEKRKMWMLVLLSLSCIFVLEISNHQFSMLGHQRLESWMNYLIFYASMLIAIFAVAFIVRELRETNYSYEQELRQQKTFFEKVFNEMPTDLVVFNAEREYIYLNPAAVRDPEMRLWMIGKTETEYMNFRSKTAEFVKIRDHAFKEVLSQKRVMEFEEAIVDRAGKTHHFIRRMHPVMNAQEEIQFVIGYGIEITPQKEAQISLMHSKLLAEQTAKAKSNFLSNVSHEIRTPLNAILGMSDLLVHDPTNNLMENLVIIQQSANNLLGLIDDILDLSKFDEGKMVIERKPFNLRNVLSEVSTKTIVLANAKKLDFETNVDSAIPDSLTGDAERVKQILTNITSNAVKFTDRGKITLKTEVIHTAPQQLDMIFKITDTGIGIAPGKREVIFESFTQAEAYTTRKYGGTGLGLNICKKLCEMMGGKITVESVQGKGSTFTIRIPFHYEVSAGEKHAETELNPIKFPTPESPQNVFANYRILMAEDNAVNQKLAIQLFKKWGANLAVAENGLEALKMVKQQKYDLVLMDLQMPEMDGITALKKIRAGEAGEENKNLVVIALTADVFEESRSKANEAGFNEFITKPYNNTELMEKMMKHLKHSA